MVSSIGRQSISVYRPIEVNVQLTRMRLNGGLVIFSVTLSASNLRELLTHNKFSLQLKSKPILVAHQYNRNRSFEMWYLILQFCTLNSWWISFFVMRRGIVIIDYIISVALNSRKSGHIANIGFMIYYGSYRSQLAILKSPKQKKKNLNKTTSYTHLLKQNYCVLKNRCCEFLEFEQEFAWDFSEMLVGSISTIIHHKP